MENCCYCRQPLGQQHLSKCIYALGYAMADIPLVKHGECNRELAHVKPLSEADKDRRDYAYCTPKGLPAMLAACKTAKEAAASAMVALATVEFSTNEHFIIDARNDAIAKLEEALAALK